jgi:HAMP domain-containing protein
MQDAPLVLRDIHQSTAPAWWPPAPGWWFVAAVVLIAASCVALWRQRRRQRLRRVAKTFDNAVDSANSAPAQIAAMSELLRRAARRRNPNADKLRGSAWLEYLDAEDKRHPFTGGAGKLLLEGGFRRDADPEEVAGLRALTRERFIEWMAK